MSNIETTRVMGAAGAPQDRTLVVPGGAQATMVLPGQADAFRTQMGGTTTCPVCKSTTPLLDPYCGDCGFLLASPPAEDLGPPSEETFPAELIDTQTGRRFRLREGVNTLGRQGTDILTNEGTVSRNHARITVANGTVTIEDLGSSNGTKVGDLRLSANQPVQATSGQPLRFGNWNVTIEISGSQAQAAPATIAMPAGGESAEQPETSSAFSDEETFIAASLVTSPSPAPPTPVESVTGGALAGVLRKIDGPADDIAVTEGVILIGRRPDNTIILTGDAYVSGRHAEIVTDSTGTYISDIGSTNGTIVNGTKIVLNERLLLTEGDEIQIGQNRFRFETLPADSDEADQENGGASDAVQDEAGRA